MPGVEGRLAAAAGAKSGSRRLRVAAALCWFDGLAFGLPAVPVAVFLAREGRLPVFLDLFPMYSGPFEAWGRSVFTVLLVLSAVTCAAEVVAGWLLWQRRRMGAVLALALVPVTAIFWVGFALPLPPLAAVIRTALVLSGWHGLEKARGSLHDNSIGA